MLYSKDNVARDNMRRLFAQVELDVLGRRLVQETRELDRRVDGLGSDRTDVFDRVAHDPSAPAADIRSRRERVESIAAYRNELAEVLGSETPTPSAAAILGAIRTNSVGGILALDPLSVAQKTALIEEVAKGEISVVNDGTETAPRFNVKGLPYIATDFDGFEFEHPKPQNAATADEAIHRAFAELSEVDPRAQRVTPQAWTWAQQDHGATWYLFDHKKSAWREESAPPYTMLTAF